MNKYNRYLRIPLGLISATIIICATVILPFIVIVCFCIKFIIPFKKAREKYLHNFIYRIPKVWSWVCEKAILISTFGCWDTPDLSKLDGDKHYLLIANHQSWFDIIVISLITYRHTAPFRFFMKQELLWQLPIAGIMCKMLGFPLLRRHKRSEIKANPALRNKDIATTRKVCRKFREYPVVFVNFPEGTRFTAKKHRAQASEFSHLLKPKAGGCSLIINELNNCLAGIIDLTIFYSGKRPSLTKLIFGQIKQISCQYKLLPISNDMLGDFYQGKEYKTGFQKWLNSRWHEKDAILDKYYCTEQ